MKAWHCRHFFIDGGLFLKPNSEYGIEESCFHQTACVRIISGVLPWCNFTLRSRYSPPPRGWESVMLLGTSHVQEATTGEQTALLCWAGSAKMRKAMARSCLQSCWKVQETMWYPCWAIAAVPPGCVLRAAGSAVDWHTFPLTYIRGIHESHI